MDKITQTLKQMYEIAISTNMSKEDKWDRLRRLDAGCNIIQTQLSELRTKHTF